MKTLTAKSGRMVATAAKKGRRPRRAPLDHAATGGVKPDATQTCLERIENQNEAEDLVQLVVKYFGDEIREALIEVEKSLLAKTLKPERPVRQGKHVRKESSRERGRKSLSVSIWKAHPQKCATDTNKDEKTQTHSLDIEALRTIGRIVRAIKKRLEPDAGGSK